jgi:hypothetical protein
MTKAPRPSPDLLRALLAYDADSGRLTWRPRSGAGVRAFRSTVIASSWASSPGLLTPKRPGKTDSDWTIYADL